MSGGELWKKPEPFSAIAHQFRGGGGISLTPPDSGNSASVQLGKRIILGPTIIPPPPPRLELFRILLPPAPDKKYSSPNSGENDRR